MSVIGSLLGSPAQPSPRSSSPPPPEPTSSGPTPTPASSTSTEPSTSAQPAPPSAQPQNPSPPPAPPRLSIQTSYAVAEAVQESAKADDSVLRPVEVEAESAPAPEPAKAAPVLNGSDVALRVLEDTVGELEARRAQEAKARSERVAEGRDPEPGARDRFEPVGNERDTEKTRRDAVFSQRASARAAYVYQTSLRTGGDDAGQTLNARF